MNKMKAAIIGLLFLLTGCAGVQTSDYINETPKFDLRHYLNGRVEAWGIFQDYQSKVTNRFYVLMDAKWNGNVGTLKEDFLFHDGKKQQRVWTITMIDDNHFKATAADVKGEAKGEQFGNTTRMRYVLNLEANGKTYEMDMDDWMYMLNDEIVVNRTKMKKYGVEVGELSLFFRKLK